MTKKRKGRMFQTVPSMLQCVPTRYLISEISEKDFKRYVLIWSTYVPMCSKVV